MKSNFNKCIIEVTIALRNMSILIVGTNFLLIQNCLKNYIASKEELNMKIRRYTAFEICDKTRVLFETNTYLLSNELNVSSTHIFYQFQKNSRYVKKKFFHSYLETLKITVVS